MDAGDPERTFVQGAAGPNHGSRSHSGDRLGVIPVPADGGKTEERSAVELNGKPWK
jgi:hypothetical protein